MHQLTTGLIRCNNEVDKARTAAADAKARSHLKKPEETLFSRIIDGSIPARIFYRDDKCLAFHDINPQAPVHFLVIPIRAIPMLEQAEQQDVEVMLDVYQVLHHSSI